MRRQRAQVLVFFAVALPLVLLPIAAFAVDAAIVAAAYSRLVEVSARAAEEAAQEIDVRRLRDGGGVTIDLAGARIAADMAVQVADPSAAVVDVAVSGQELKLATTETVVLPFDLFGDPQRILRATVTARITVGYDSPSSLLPLPVSTF